MGLIGLLACGVVPAAKADHLVEGAVSTATWRVTGECPGGPVDAPDSRDGKIEAAASYWEFHSRHDGSRLRVIPDVVRIEDGAVTARSADEICNGTTSLLFYAESHNIKRWAVVDGDWVVGFVHLENGPYGTGSYHFGAYHVTGGLVDHFEEINWIGDNQAYLYGDWDTKSRVDHTTDNDDVMLVQHSVGDATVPSPADRAVVQDAVNLYLDGFARHDGSGVPLAPDARRVENLRLRGQSAEEIRAQLEAPTMTVTRVVPERLQVFIEGENAVAYYEFEHLDGGSTRTRLGGTRFRVQDGLIVEIESVCSGGLDHSHPYCGDSGTDDPNTLIPAG